MCVSDAHQGKGLGQCIMKALTSVALNVGCLKTSLECDDDHEEFYSKCGYEKGGIGMGHEFEGMKEWDSDDE